MYLVIIEPNEEVRKFKEERYLSDRVFFNFMEAWQFGQEQMKLHPVKATLVNFSTLPYLTPITLEGSKP